MASTAKDRSLPDGERLACDVLVVGGGPAAAWAALSAAEAGASVVLADKGYFGTSGATAPSNTGTWCVPPGEGRLAAVEARWKRTAGLGDRRWMLRCVDQSFENLSRLVEWGYPFPSDDGGNLYVANLRGPDYMRFMRAQVAKRGVRILDHHPLLELLGDGHAVAGARGLSRRSGASFEIAAGAVVLASGGCAYFERILGGTGLTGDGHLFAAEAGAAMSGLEFTAKYTLAPRGSSLNKGLPFRWASFYRADGTPLRGPDGEPVTNGIGAAERLIADALTQGEVLARFDLADPAIAEALRRGQPNCFTPYERMGLDPFRDLFPVELKFEGTVRGTGGIRIASADCSVGVPGLFAAGDAASRENVTGGVSGGGAVNASWAMASGWWAGRGASLAARRPAAQSGRRLTALGRAGLRPSEEARPVDLARAVAEVRGRIAPLARNYRRHAETLAEGRRAVEAVWRDVEAHLQADGAGRLRAREVAAVTAVTRWTLAAAELRTETRGAHRRSDFPETDVALARRITVAGLRTVRAEWDEPAEALLEGAAS
ncbi:FAD-binding protein [Aureimonas sp. AU22]|uniref:FAD-binding protein n=1 Tax=Aureimonas sp. AU22 TaxID=1638162 RepID=UPI00078410C8|nr:FAD-binding protein [Aureimonas sp. AU22]